MRRSMRDRIKKNIKKKQEGTSTKYINIEKAKWYKPKRNVIIDIIPYIVSISNHPDGVEKGEMWWVMPYKQHNNIGSDEKSYVCLKTFGEDCPVCEDRAKLLKKGYDENKEIIDALKPKDRMLLQLIDTEDRDKGIQLMDISYYCFGKQLDIELDEGSDDLADFALPEDGLSLKIRFIEEKLGKNSFLKADRIDFIERDEQYDESICEEGYQLDKLLRVLSYDELSDIFYDRRDFIDVISGSDEKSDGEEKVEEKEDKKVRQNKRKVKEQGEDDHDEEIEDKEEQNVTEEKEVQRRTRRKREKENKNKCPYGYKFGIDTDTKPECDECEDETWAACTKGEV